MNHAARLVIVMSIVDFLLLYWFIQL